MTTVRVAPGAISSGAATIERELVQLKILSSLPGGETLVLSSAQPEEVLQLARWRGVRMSKKRETNETSIAELWKDRLRVSVIIACHNYGHYLDEAIRSVLAQSYLPDEILLSDDASNDDSPEIMQSYARRYPELIHVNLNQTNLGIQAHFNRVVEIASGDLIVIVGADNRIPANYVEDQFTALATDESLGIAYTDFALFGGRAKSDYDRMRPDFRGERLPNGVFMSDFPEYTTYSAALLREGHNFIHGSSMYRKAAWEQVGGYRNRKNGPEDMSLFQAMLATGLGATKLTNTVLEYRQHSAEQANYQFSYFGELQRLRELSMEYEAVGRNVELLHEQVRMNELELERLRFENELLRREAEGLGLTISELKSSHSYRLGRRILSPLRVFFRR
ncbi:glycosyltransferase family 2 protein [Leucobacter sp. W1478]|uniref:glycosyltransferase family 2 protein n=1 Tax=Leucobacter sp. W1478 TaxID=3439065 RepID=UPI003F335AEE